MKWRMLKKAFAIFSFPLYLGDETGGKRKCDGEQDTAYLCFGDTGNGRDRHKSAKQSRHAMKFWTPQVSTYFRLA